MVSEAMPESEKHLFHIEKGELGVQLANTAQHWEASQ